MPLGLFPQRPDEGKLTSVFTLMHGKLKGTYRAVEEEGGYLQFCHVPLHYSPRGAPRKPQLHPPQSPKSSPILQLLECETEYRDYVMHNEVRWLSRDKIPVLKLALLIDITYNHYSYQ